MSERPLNSVVRQSPLHYVKGRKSGATTGDKLGLTITEIDNGCYLSLRGDAGDAAFVDGVNSVLGLAMPTTPNTYEHNQTSALYWQGPNEWLLTSDRAAGELEADLRAALKGHVAVVDVTGGLTQINLSGDSLMLVLKKSSVYDFEGWEFSNQQRRCVQTTLAKASALVARQDANAYRLIIRRSFADYIAQWLLDAGSDQGCRIDS